jgi:hypothetical protein
MLLRLERDESSVLVRILHGLVAPLVDSDVDPDG